MFGIKTLETKLRKDFNADLKRGSEIMTLHSQRLAELKQYIECSVCGVLVSKEKATMKQEMRDKVAAMYGRLCYGFEVNIQTGEKEIVKIYTCLHCQPKTKKK